MNQRTHIVVWSPKTKGARPKVGDIHFKKIIKRDEQGRITVDEGEVIFRNGYGVQLRRHYRYTTRQQSLTHYSAVIFKVLQAGGKQYLRINANTPDNLKTDDNRYRISTRKQRDTEFVRNDENVAHPQNLGRNPAPLKPIINIFLRKTQCRKAHDRAPEKTMFVTPEQHRNIARGLPKALKPNTRQLRLDL